MQSKVYFISANRNEGHASLAKKAEKIFRKIGLEKHIEKDSFVVLKIHFGEQGNTGFIKPQWIVDIIHHIKSKTSRVFLTDSNTLYVGRRSNSVDHLQLAWEHGFTREAVGIPVIIADGLIGRDDDDVPVNLSHVKSAKIARVFLNSDVMVCLTHFTGHMVTGFGGTVKNMGMGCASRAGKLEQHSDLHPWIDSKVCEDCGVCLDYCPTQAIIRGEKGIFINEDKCIGCGECLVVCDVGAVKFRWDSDSVRIQEKMSEYAFSVGQHFKNKMGCLNFLLKITKDCDCMAKDNPPIVEDIGILGSPDPVALDKASVDLINQGNSRDILKVGYDVDWSVQLKHGAQIGLGNMDYELIEIT